MLPQAQHSSDGETTKLLIELQDGMQIESVIMFYDSNTSESRLTRAVLPPHPSVQQVSLGHNIFLQEDDTEATEMDSTDSRGHHSRGHHAKRDWTGFAHFPQSTAIIPGYDLSVSQGRMGQLRVADWTTSESIRIAVCGGQRFHMVQSAVCCSPRTPKNWQGHAVKGQDTSRLLRIVQLVDRCQKPLSRTFDTGGACHHTLTLLSQNHATHPGPNCVCPSNLLPVAQSWFNNWELINYINLPQGQPYHPGPVHCQSFFYLYHMLS